MKRHNAFTLVELLVLIAAGGLAGAVLLASLGDAKDKVRAATCTSNLREISMAIRLYTDDHNGFMPTASADFVTWPKRLGSYLPLRGTNATPASNKPYLVFVCPSANYPGTRNQDLGTTYSCTAAMMGRATPPDITPGSTVGLTATQPRRQSQVYTPPAETPLIIEGKADPSGAPPVTSAQSVARWNAPEASTDLASAGPSSCNYLDFRHRSDAMNIAFFDGSVRAVSFAQAKATFTKSLWEGR